MNDILLYALLCFSPGGPWPNEPGNWQFCYFDDRARLVANEYPYAVTTERDNQGDLVVVCWNAEAETPCQIHRTQCGYMHDGITNSDASQFWKHVGVWQRID